MKVSIKKFDVEMEVKNKGIEFDVYSPNGADHLGDCIVTKTGLIWCEGRERRANGVSVTWAQFIAWMNEQR